ncbi:MAG: M1 family metallopeptidase [Acidimicrobiia bacterium]|nr:M1 family metallopeptidase [Acidimicrobiia bacterium]
MPRHAAIVLTLAGALAACSGDGGSDAAATTPIEPPTTTAAAIPATTTTTAPPTPLVFTCPDLPVGLGDSNLEGSGNTGYDVLAYDLAFDFDIPALVSEPPFLEATATLSATATESLNAFSLDLLGMEVESVTVDGTPVEWCRKDRELIVGPRFALAIGDGFSVRIDYSGHPTEAEGLFDEFTGVQRAPTGVFVVLEPDGASSLFPSNDHPRDPAMFRVTVTAPSHLEVISVGRLVAETSEGDRTTSVWESTEPVATYLLPLAIGDFDMIEVESELDMDIYLYEGSSGVGDFALQPQMVEFFESLFGPYPYDRLGAIVVDSPAAIALETQGIPTYSRDFAFEDVIAHEIAHQWVGDYVRLDDWSDIWLKEGLASFAELLWAEHNHGLERYTRQINGIYGFLAEDPLAHPPALPERDEMYTGSVYWRGAFTMVALRDLLGDEPVFGLLRAWVDTYGGKTATTADFLALVEARLGTEAFELASDWLTDETIPPLEARGLEPIVGG